MGSKEGRLEVRDGKKKERTGGERSSEEVKHEEEERKGQELKRGEEKMRMNKRRSIPMLRQLVPPAANSNCEYLYACVRVCVYVVVVVRGCGGCCLSELLSKWTLSCASMW